MSERVRKRIARAAYNICARMGYGNCTYSKRYVRAALLREFKQGKRRSGPEDRY